MRRLISSAALISLLLCPFCGLYAQDKMVAVVNNEIITQKDLNDFLNFMRMQYARELDGKALEEKVNSVKQDLLQRLIEDRIMLQQAKNEKIIIEPSRLKAKINEIKRRYALESDFERDLAKQGLVQADLENKIREQMLTFSIVEMKVRNKVAIRPEEVTDFYDQNKRKFIKPEERLLTVIILQDESAAKSLSYYLRLGEKLESLAARYTFTADTLIVSQGQSLRSEIEDTVFKLGMAEVSNPVKIDRQYYIFRLDEILGSRQLDLAESQEKIQAYLFEKKQQEGLTNWLDELKKQSYIKILDN
jgi:parvulin-like peptidyl-prolyl isomerase